MLNKILPLQNLSCQMTLTEKAGPFSLFCKQGSWAVLHVRASVLLKSAHSLGHKDVWKKLCQTYRSSASLAGVFSLHATLSSSYPVVM